MNVEDDGVKFPVDSLDVGPIREEQDYGGVRILLLAFVTTAKVRLQVDIGFGDTFWCAPLPRRSNAGARHCPMDYPSRSRAPLSATR